MSGWLVLSDKDGNYSKYETAGESRVEVAGAPIRSIALGEGSYVSVEWFAEEPEVKGKTVEEAAAEAEAAEEPVEEEASAKTTAKSK
jgi:hypothetical protein